MAASIDEQRIQSIFFQEYLSEAARVQKEGTRFAYYTSSDVAFLILKNKEIWLRNTMAMNDYMEVEYGLNCLINAYKSDSGKFFQSALDGCFSNLTKDIESHFNAWIPAFKRDTFVTCFSEHSPHEDINGRLSMWRAYGGRSGVALVFNNAPMFLKTQELAAYSNPVAYASEEQMAMYLIKIGESINSEVKFISQLDREHVKNIVFHMFRTAALCNKHPGFSEEKEWRVISSPTLQKSDLVSQEAEVVRGIPQTVLKIKLKDHPDKGIVGLEIPQFLERIIIGPCEFPWIVFRALADLLTQAGVTDVTSKIFISDIPLRHSN